MSPFGTLPDSAASQSISAAAGDSTLAIMICVYVSTQGNGGIGETRVRNKGAWPSAVLLGTRTARRRSWLVNPYVSFLRETAGGSIDLYYKCHSFVPSRQIPIRCSHVYPQPMSPGAGDGGDGRR